MQITDLDQRQFTFTDGLREIQLKMLRKIVVLAGPNGSGKSRLLNRISALDSSVTDGQGNLHVKEKFVIANEPINAYGHVELATFGRVKATSLGVYVKDRGSTQPYTFKVARFDPQEFSLNHDPALMPVKDVPRKGKGADRLGSAQLDQCGLAYIQMIQNRRYEVTHPDSTAAPEVRRIAVLQYDRLCELIKIGLGVSLSRDVEGRATIFGEPIFHAGLSYGQISLLMWAISIHSQSLKLKDCVVIIDEPESFLHPESMLSTIHRVIDVVIEGQVWIATHSVPLIASLFKTYNDDLTLAFMENGRATYAGREPERVLKSLMGGDTNILALREFIDLPEMLAVNRFASECLLDPTVVADAAPSDPQIRIASSAILPPGRKNVRVLDFGAGHGRLLDSLAALFNDSLPSLIDYVAWDLKPAKSCSTVIERVYGNSHNRLHSDRNSLSACYPHGTFDVVVMCNVLHEIDPKEWTELFSSSGMIYRQLKDDGQLVIIEDYLMPKGEYAHPFGFIVLDTEATQSLFRSSSECPAIKVIHATEKYKDRIKGHIIPKSLLPRVSNESRRDALLLANRSAADRIRALRSSGKNSFRSGLEHAYWVQQYTNTSLAIAQLG